MGNVVSFKHSGNFNNIEKFIKKTYQIDFADILSAYGRAGVEALQNATPVRTGETMNSWDYTIERGNNRYTIYWTNDHIHSGVNVAIILQYGHGTGTGGYVQGTDYINKATAKIFEAMAEQLWNEVANA